MPNNNIIKAIIFDHDGTLVDSEGIHCQCWNKTIVEFLPQGSTLGAQNAQPLSYDEYCMHYNGLPTIETATRIAKHFKLNTTPKALYENKINRLNEQLANGPFPLLPYVIETLDDLLMRKIPMAIASGANKNEVATSVKAHKLDKYFQILATKQDVKHSKPAPDVYLLAAQHLGVNPTQCLAIEDSDTGYYSAIAAGMKCLRLTPTPIKPLEFSNMLEIHHYLKKMLTTR